MIWWWGSLCTRPPSSVEFSWI